MVLQFAKDKWAEFAATVRAMGSVTGVFYYVPVGQDAWVWAVVNDGRNILYLNGTYSSLTQAVVLADFPDAVQHTAQVVTQPASSVSI